jgi:predicted nucleotidyltransferase
VQAGAQHLKIDANKIRGFCRRHGISRLELFGSALRSDFREESDVDFLATLRPDAHPTLLDWAKMQEELAGIIGREVDLVSRRAVERSRNAYRREPILATATPIYAEG